MVWIANFGAAMFQIDIVLKLTAAALQFGNHAFELRNPSLALVEAESLLANLTIQRFHGVGPSGISQRGRP